LHLSSHRPRYRPSSHRLVLSSSFRRPPHPLVFVRVFIDHRFPPGSLVFPRLVLLAAFSKRSSLPHHHHYLVTIFFHASLPSHRLSLPSRRHDIPPTTLLLFKPYLTSLRHLFRGRLNCKILKTLRRTWSFCHHRLLDARRTVVPHPSPQFSPFPPCSFAFLARYPLHTVHCWFHPSSPVSSRFAAFMQFFAGFHPGSPPFPSGSLPFSCGSLLVSSQFAGFIPVPTVCVQFLAGFIPVRRFHPGSCRLRMALHTPACCLFQAGCSLVPLVFPLFVCTVIVFRYLVNFLFSCSFLYCFFYP